VTKPPPITSRTSAPSSIRAVNVPAISPPSFSASTSTVAGPRPSKTRSSPSHSRQRATVPAAAIPAGTSISISAKRPSSRQNHAYTSTPRGECALASRPSAADALKASPPGPQSAPSHSTSWSWTTPSTRPGRSVDPAHPAAAKTPTTVAGRVPIRSATRA
jgi:hypothetical protein